MHPSDTPPPKRPKGDSRQDRDRVVVPFKPRPAPRRPEHGNDGPGPDDSGPDSAA